MAAASFRKPLNIITKYYLIIILQQFRTSLLTKFMVWHTCAETIRLLAELPLDQTIPIEQSYEKQFSLRWSFQPFWGIILVIFTKYPLIYHPEFSQTLEYLMYFICNRKLKNKIRILNFVPKNNTICFTSIRYWI